MRVGILGGGQLARMTIAAAIGLGIDVAIFEREADSPAGRLTTHEIVGPWEDPELQARFAALCDVITLESEFVDPAILAAFAALGVPVRPGAATLDPGRRQAAPERDVRRRTICRSRRSAPSRRRKRCCRRARNGAGRSS